MSFLGHVLIHSVSWGESAGAISVSLHMLVNKGDQEGLFRGAIMQSGGPIPVGDIENGQQYYDTLVKNAACDKSPDTLECLRSIPYERFKYAMDLSPNFFAYQVKTNDISVIIGRMLTGLLGTCSDLVTSRRWRFLDGATATCCFAWPRVECTYDHRRVP
jgi:hypothetical protein